MTGFSNELVKDYGVEGSYQIFETMMTDTAQITQDKAVFSNVAGSALRPPGLLFGVAPLTPSTGTGLDALVGDLKKMAGAMATAGVTSDGAVIVAHPEQVEALGALPPQQLKHAVYGTIAVPPGTVIMIQTQGLAVGYDGNAELRLSPDATAHMSDTPTNIGTPGSPATVAAPTLSAFQTDTQLLRLTLKCAWAIRPGAIQYVNADLVSQ